MATVRYSEQQQRVTTRCRDDAGSNVRPVVPRRFHTDPLSQREVILLEIHAAPPRAQSEPKRKSHDKATDAVQLPPSVKPPPPLPTRFRIDGAVDPGSSLLAQVEKIAQYSLHFTHTWAALKQSLELTLFRPEMLRCPTVIFMEPMENTIDLKDSVLVLMRKNGLPHIVVAVDAPANLPKAPSVTLPKAPPALAKALPALANDVECWSMQHPEPKQPPP